MEKLADHRPERPAGHDDRTFRPERTTRANRNRRRKRLQNSQPRMNTAPVHQDRFNRFRNAMSSNALRPIPRHQTDDQRPHDRHRHRVNAEMVPGRRSERSTEMLVVEKVREKADQLQQKPRDIRADNANRNRHQRDRNHPTGSRKIPELLQARLMALVPSSLTHSGLLRRLPERCATAQSASERAGSNTRNSSRCKSES